MRRVKGRERRRVVAKGRNEASIPYRDGDEAAGSEVYWL